MAASGSPSRSFIRHLWLSFLLYTGATWLFCWWCQAMPAGPEELLLGRGLVLLPAAVLWVVGLLMTLAFWLTARRTEMSPSSGRTWSVVLWSLAVVSTGIVLAMTRPWDMPTSFHYNEQATVRNMRPLLSAQADFKANDRDGNKIPDFWVGDVSGLYRIVPPAESDMIKLIELGTAAADRAPAEQPGTKMKPVSEIGLSGPRAGFWFRAMTHYIDESGGKTAYDRGQGRSPDRFGYCAFPDSPAAGKRTLIVNEKGVIYWKILGGGPVDTFPADPAKEGWTKVE